MRTSPLCLAGRLLVVSHQKFRLFYTDGGTPVSDCETSAGWGAVARSPDGKLYVSCLVRSSQPKRISRMQAPDSIPTTLLNSRVSLRRFHSLGPMPCRSRPASLCLLRFKTFRQRSLGDCPITRERPFGAHLPASPVTNPIR